MKCKSKKLKFGNNGDIFQEHSDYDVDYKLSSDDNTRGEYFNNSERTSIYLKNHESLFELILTNIHEDLHRGIAICDEDNNIDIEQEHIIIKLMLQLQFDMNDLD